VVFRSRFMVASFMVGEAPVASSGSASVVPAVADMVFAAVSVVAAVHADGFTAASALGGGNLLGGGFGVVADLCPAVTVDVGARPSPSRRFGRDGESKEHQVGEHHHGKQRHGVSGAGAGSERPDGGQTGDTGRGGAEEDRDGGTAVPLGWPGVVAGRPGCRLAFVGVPCSGGAGTPQVSGTNHTGEGDDLRPGGTGCGELGGGTEGNSGEL
jgi:hypothetical protein